MLAWSTILIACHALLAQAPRAAVVSLDATPLPPDQRASIEAALAVQGYQGLDPVDSARLQSEAAPAGDAQALAIAAKKAFLTFDNAAARAHLATARALLCESPRVLSERSLLADLHLLEGQIALSEGRQDDTTRALALAALLEPERALHPGVYPPDLIEAAARARAWLDAQPRGALVVESWPAGALVYVDGVYRGEAPVVVEALAAGAHYATAVVEGRGARSRLVEVAGGRSARVHLGVPDPVQLAQLPALLPAYRAAPDATATVAALLPAVGAELLIGWGQERDAVARAIAGAPPQVVVVPASPDPLDVEARVARLLQALPGETSGAPTPSSRATTTAPAEPDPVPDDAAGAVPWAWLGAGAGALLLAGGIAAAVAIALNWPRPEPPQDRVDIYLGGGGQ